VAGLTVLEHLLLLSKTSGQKLSNLNNGNLLILAGLENQI